MLSGVLKSGLVPTAARHLLHRRQPQPVSHLRAPSAHALNSLQRNKHVTTRMGGPNRVFSMGPTTLQIDRQRFHEPIRQNVVKRMQEQLQEGQRGVLVVQVRSAGPRLALCRSLNLCILCVIRDHKQRR
jgi:hypothetical protein